MTLIVTKKNQLTQHKITLDFFPRALFSQSFRLLSKDTKAASKEAISWEIPTMLAAPLHIYDLLHVFTFSAYKLGKEKSATPNMIR